MVPALKQDSGRARGRGARGGMRDRIRHRGPPANRL